MKTFAIAWMLSVIAYGAIHLADAPLALVLVGAGALSVGLGLAGAEMRGAWIQRPLAPALIVPASLAVAVWPLATDLWLAADPRAALRAATVWPQFLVLLFASRLLAETSLLASGEAWAAGPARRGPGAALHRSGLWSAALLGGAFALAFYAALARMGNGPVASAAADALFGETPVNALILLVFFIVLAELAELWLATLRDRLLLASLSARRAGGADDLRAQIEALSAESRHSAALRRVLGRFAEAGRGARAEIAAAEIEASLHHAARRYLRSLLGSLPLIGFAGTVLGIMGALAALPDLLDGAARGGGLAAALSGTLGGLATAFQTTLLGLVGSLIATLLLAALERAEAATMAAADLLASDADGGS